MFDVYCLLFVFILYQVKIFSGNKLIWTKIKTDTMIHNPLKMEILRVHKWFLITCILSISSLCELCTFVHFCVLFYLIGFVELKTFKELIGLSAIPCTQLKFHSILLKMLYHCRYSFAHETRLMHWIIFFSKQYVEEYCSKLCSFAK